MTQSVSGEPAGEQDSPVEAKPIDPLPGGALSSMTNVGCYESIEASRALREVVERLEADRRLPGVLVMNRGGYLTALCRRALTYHLTRPYFRDVFFNKPIAHMLSAWRPTHLELAADTPIHAAIEQVLAREENDRYEPIVVVDPEGRRWLLDVHQLLTHQCRALERAVATAQAFERLVAKQNERFRHDARHDKLTGLPNRAHLHERIRSGVEACGLAFIDFDRFKLINDSLGHACGDELLQQVADRLRDLIGGLPTPERWMAARLGGDEFVIFVERPVGLDELWDLTERLRARLREPFCLQGHEVVVTPSIGVTTSELSGRDPDRLLRDADAAMYRAKAAGRDRAAVFDRSMLERTRARLRLENDLRRALDDDQICLAYQPIVAVDTGRVVGCEALIRWRHPVQGLIAPDQFIPVAEESGLILPLGRRVLEMAVGQVAAWRVELDRRVSVSVNLSKRQLLEPGLVRVVEGVLNQADVEPRQLNLEITESIVMDCAENVVPILEGLRALGVVLSMDDFGKGHSSLNCLHRFPIDVLKIDRSFIGNLGRRQAYSAVVQAIVTLAKNLGLRVVAEGIETPDQLAEIQALECECGQGYLFSTPVWAAGMAPLLQRQTLDRAFLAERGAGSAAAA